VKSERKLVWTESWHKIKTVLFIIYLKNRYFLLLNILEEKLFIDRAANHSKKFQKKKVKFCNLLKISEELFFF
jgi:hypothetical protein